MFKRSLVLSLAAASAILLLALGCQQTAAPQLTPKPAEGRAAATPTKAAEKAAERPVRGGTLRVISGEPASLDAHLGVIYGPASMIHDTLIALDTKLAATKEGLAKDWTISADGKTVTFKLREGIKFQDGTDFDAAAVKFNIERVGDPATKSVVATNYASVGSVEVVDSTTVRFNLKQPDPLLLPRLGQTSGLMASPTAARKYGQEFARNPVGTGPFRFVEWVLGDHITFKRFEGYWGKDRAGVQLPYLDEVVLKIIPDENVAFANLRTGQVDFQHSVPQSLLPLLKKEPNLSYTSIPNSHGVAVYLNTKRPPFDNKALRQAVALAVDREGIAARMGEGATLSASVFNPMSWGSDPKVPDFPSRDLARAKAKMAEAGYPSGGLKVKSTNGNGLEVVRDAEIVKANLAEIGIEMEIEALAGNAIQAKVRVEMNYQMNASHSTGSEDVDPGHFAGIALHSQGSRNYYGPYSNPKVNELTEKAGNMYDQKEREPLYREIAKLVADDLPFVRLYVGNSFAAMNKKVRNYIPSPVVTGLPMLKDVWLAQ